MSLIGRLFRSITLMFKTTFDVSTLTTSSGSTVVPSSGVGSGAVPGVGVGVESEGGPFFCCSTRLGLGSGVCFCAVALDPDTVTRMKKDRQREANTVIRQE